MKRYAYMKNPLRITLPLLLLTQIGTIATAGTQAPGAVYFDSDMLEVRKQDLKVIEAHCRYAAEHPEQRVQLQGHADQRGGREFSLVIGQRRAESVSRRLRACGVAAERLESVSYGKERPARAGYSPTANRLNRRVDIVYLPQP